MADETTIESNAAVSTEAAPAASEPKKNRGGRPRKVVSEVAKSEAKTEASPAAAATGKRKAAVKAKAIAPAAAAPAKKTRAPRVAKAAKPANSASPVAIDDLADLLQLEEENQKLRKQLAEKLRSENADLKKRLGIA